MAASSVGSRAVAEGWLEKELERVRSESPALSLLILAVAVNIIDRLTASKKREGDGGAK